MSDVTLDQARAWAARAAAARAEVAPVHGPKGERVVSDGPCYCGKRARRAVLLAGRTLYVCSAWCGQRLPAFVARNREAL